MMEKVSKAMLRRVKEKQIYNCFEALYWRMKEETNLSARTIEKFNALADAIGTGNKLNAANCGGP